MFRNRSKDISYCLIIIIAFHVGSFAANRKISNNKRPPHRIGRTVKRVFIIRRTLYEANCQMYNSPYIIKPIHVRISTKLSQ